jgi:hypothetical protein
MLGDVSPLTCRSYAYDLLRWFRLLWLLEAAWDGATEAETAVLVGWLRTAANPQRRRRWAGSPVPGSVNLRTGKPEPGGGYARATIAHALAVVGGFYDFHLHYAGGRWSILSRRAARVARPWRIALRWSSPQAIAGRR